MSDIREGDVVVCVDDSHARKALKIGRLYRVIELYIVQDSWTTPGANGCLALRLDGVRPTPCGNGRLASRFRKIEAPKTELSERIRKCRPVPAKVEETALDRLAARLGEGRMSPEVADSLREVTDRDAAYGRMIEASIARDDAGYERAKAEFWGMGL